jgi:proline racemase/trans-L-3-hydroxyproline dehydratase
VRVEAGRAYEVSFNSPPVFVYQLDACLSVPGLGDLLVDIVYSGGFFALVDASAIGLQLVPSNAGKLADLGTRVLDAANAGLSVQHPVLSFMTVVDAVEFHNPAQRQPDGSLHARNVATFGERTVDRSPCGTGTCARLAVLHARGALSVGQRFVSESIIGTSFVGRILEETDLDEYQAIIPRVTGRAYLTGFHQFVLDPDDPFPGGFSLSQTAVKGDP